MCKKMLIVVLFVILLPLVMGGCGGKSWDTYSYYDPNWTPEGLIYAKQVISHYKESWDGLFLGGMHQYVDSEEIHYVTMDTNGNNEQLLPYSYYPYFSPKGTYVAYVDSASTVHIVRRSDNQELYSFQPTTDKVSEIDWNPDETKIVYTVTLNDVNSSDPYTTVYISDIDGANKKKLSEGMTAVWSPSENLIVFNRHYRLSGVPSGDGLCTYLTTNEAINKIPSLGTREGGDPDFTSDSQTIIYDHGLDIPINTINVFSGIKTSILDKQLYRLKWFSLGIVYVDDSDSGVWFSNVDGSGLKQIK